MAHPPPYEAFDSEKLKPMDVDVQSVSSTEYISEEGQTLHVYHDNWKGRDGKIYDSDKRTVLYEIAQRNRKPQLTVREPSTQATIGTLEFHTWSRKMDADLRGNKFPLGTSKMCWKSVDVHYNSPAFSQPMRWKRSTIWVVLSTTLLDLERCRSREIRTSDGEAEVWPSPLLRSDLTKIRLMRLCLLG